MAVSSDTKRVQYNGNGSTVEFTVSFYFLDQSHLSVILTDSSGNDTTQTITTHYTVTGAGDESGGTVTMVTAPASGEKLTIIRNVPLTQATDYVENDPFPADTHEEALDKLTMISQQLDEVATRALKAPTSTSITDGELTDTEVVANYYLKINSSANGFQAVSPATAGTELALSTVLTPTDGNFIVGDGTTWTAESGATVRTSLGLGTGDSPTFTDLTLSGWMDLADTKGIRDGNNNEWIKFAQTASAVNEVTFTNAATTNSPSITATGGDTNVGLTIDTKGTGTLALGSADSVLTIDGSGISGTLIKDEDTMTSDSATHLATQQSIKAYVDSQTGLGNVVEDTTPQLGGQLDVNGNAIGDGTRELLTFTEDASAVNHVNIENEATGSGPIISAAGDDTNVDLNLVGKGTGNVKVGVYTFDGDQSVGAGQDNYVMTYDNASGLVSLEVATGGGGGLVFLSSATASSSASIEFTSLIDSTYEMYAIMFDGIYAGTDDSYLLLQVSTDNGSTWVSSGYMYGNVRSNMYSSGVTGENSTSAAHLPVTTTAGTVQIGNDATQAANGLLFLQGVNDTSARTSLSGTTTNTNTGGENNVYVSGVYDATTAVNAIRFTMDSGNIAAGTITLYGVGSSS